MRRVEAAIDAIRDALERERRAITSGRLELIVRLAAQRKSLMRELGIATAHSESGVDASLLADLRREIELNQTMLSSAAAGIKSVVDRIGDIRAAAGRLTTYGADGLKTEHIRNSAKPRRLEHKA